MNKKILHLQIPLNNGNGRISLTPRELGDFIHFIEGKLGDDWIVIASPCIPTVFDEDITISNFSGKILSSTELNEMLNNNK